MGAESQQRSGLQASRSSKKEALDQPTNQFHSRVNASRTREASETKQRSYMDSRIVLVERLLRERNSIIESE